MSVSVSGQPSSTPPLPRVSIIVVGFNNENDLRLALPALEKTDYPDFEIVLNDNGSQDGTLAFVRTNHPGVKLIDTGENLGFGGGNNSGAKHATGEILAFINPDTTVEPGWLTALVRPLLADDKLGITTSKVLIMNPPDQINTCGNDVHFTGYGYLRGFRESAASAFTADESVFSMSGAAFAIRKSLYDRLAGFDAAFYPTYVEDTDLSWRVRLLGYDIRYIHASIIYHNYKAAFSAGKYACLERNRWQMLLKVYRWATLALLWPALFMAEIVSWGYAIMNGRQFMAAKWSTYGYLRQNWKSIMERRKATRLMRTVKDRDLIKLCTHRLAYGQVEAGIAVKVGKYVFDPLFWLLQRLYLLIIRW